MARKKVEADTIDFTQIGKQVDSSPISEEVNNSFLEYAFSVIYSRAIPDARDGLKPVHRRILYSMIESGYTPEKPHVKSAKIVGATMGTYHPHGDCLSGDTLIVTPTGETFSLKELTDNKVETLEVLTVNDRGDIVKTKASGFRIGQTTTKVFNITTLNGHTIQATANHPFLTASNEWVRAEDLQTGDVLKSGILDVNNSFSKNGDISLNLNYIISVEAVELTEPKDMYDFTVEGYENLFIAQKIDGLLSIICVHNSAIYEAMVRLQQPFAMRVPLVDGHGNFGSSPDDSAAASRYCVVGDTHVRLSDGTSIRMDKLVASPNDSEREVNVGVLDWSGKPVKAVKAFNSGLHPVKRVTLKNGQSIAGSYNHPLLTLSNVDGIPSFVWKTLEELSVGDEICIPRISSPNNTISGKEEYDAAGVLFGAWVSEGWFTEKRAGFNNTDKKYFDMVLEAFDKIIGTKRYVGKTILKSGKPCYSIDIQPAKNDEKNSLLALSKTILGELAGLRSEDKVVPEFIWESIPNVKRSFLASIFEGDGSIRFSMNKDKYLTSQIKYSSKSIELVKGLQELLLEFGIYSNISTSTRCGRSENSLSISSNSQVKKFIETIGFVAFKASTAETVLNKINAAEKTVSLSGDFTPLVSEYVKANLLNSEVSKKDTSIILKNNFDRVDRWDENRNDVVSTVMTLDKDNIVSDIMARKYFYSPIISITDEEEQVVYSIKVDTEDHSFLAGGFINHNTESRLHKNGQLFIGEIKEKAVDFRPNYDSTTEEPVVLPATFPNLLINGTTGIAVGMTTNIPSHNPDEIIEATRYLMTHPNAKLDKIMEMVPGPDFPTGGVIMGQEGIREAYETGVGKITLRAKVEIEPITGGRHRIIADELPYGVGAEKIIEKIKDGISAKRLVGISKFMDLSDRRLGTHLVIETKSGINPKTVLAQLYKYTQFETTFGVQSVALVKGQPKTLGLIELLQIFIDHRLEVVLRRSQNRLEKKEARRHIVEGMLKILANIDKVIALIRASETSQEAKEKLMKEFKLDDIQAEYVLSIPLRRLTKYDTLELNNEKANLDKEIADLQDIINNPEVLRKLVSSELADVKKQITSDRRTVISGAANVEEEAKLLKAVVEATTTGSTAALQATGEPVTVFIDKDGNLTKKRTPVTLGSIESPVMFIAMNNKGEAQRVDVHAPSFSIKNVLTLAPNEAKGFLVMGTKKGVVKIANPDYPLRSDEFTMINLDSDDELVGAAWVENPADYNIVFVSSDSSFLKIEAEKVRPQGRTGGGMAGIALEAGQHVVGFGVVRKDDLDASLTTYTGVSVKTTPLGEYPTKGRATKGMRSHRFLKGEDKLVVASVGSKPVAFSGGSKVDLPPKTNKRDGSGTQFSLDKIVNAN